MAVFRVAKTRDYTVMSNYHLKDKALSLKSKGLLSVMLSLPEDWDYTLKGLACISKDGVDAIREAVRELERAGYIVRTRMRNEKGQLKNTEYVIYERPVPVSQKPVEKTPVQESPVLESPMFENPMQDNPVQESPAQATPVQGNPTQLITNQLKTYESNTQRSNPYQSNPVRADGWDEMDLGTINRTRFEVMEQIEYDAIVQPHNREMLDEIVELMTEVLCSTKARITVSGNDFPAEYVKDRLRKLDCNHIEYVFDALSKKRTDVRNIKQYMLTTLFNAPSTISSYYDAVARRDRLI